MSMQSKLEDKLRLAFAPDHLQVINESHLHVGHHHVEGGHHGAFDGTGETHFRISIVSQAFSGKSRIERHRAINALLADELQESIHALAIEATAPGKI
jgi:BolA family transcriptional regulator, general stress-responsive regulator